MESSITYEGFSTIKMKPSKTLTVVFKNKKGYVATK